MEESRFRIAAMSAEDLRCKGLLDGMVGEIDPRYKGLYHGMSTEMEDPRCGSAVPEMEDPRCNGINRAW